MKKISKQAQRQIAWGFIALYGVSIAVLLLSTIS